MFLSTQARAIVRSTTAISSVASSHLQQGANSLNFVPRRHCGLLALCDDVWGSINSSSSHSDASLLVDVQALRRVTDIMTHRGPDGGVVAQGNLVSGTGQKWAMGHRRLAIVAPESRKADQPFVLDLPHPKGSTKSGNRRIALAANGEVYNHLNIYDRLKEEVGWTTAPTSKSDCEAIAHAYAALGVEGMFPIGEAPALDGMFAFVLFEEGVEGGDGAVALAARDPCGIKPLYMGRATEQNGGGYIFSSELKALVDQVQADTVLEVPAGHYWTPASGLVRYHQPAWLTGTPPLSTPWESGDDATGEEVVAGLDFAVKKRMMADVEYGMFLSGGVDSCIVGSLLLPRWRREMGDDRPLPAYTVGLEGSPDMTAARAWADAVGGAENIDHRERVFTVEEATSIEFINKIVYHMETYEAELIRSAVPNWMLAERAAVDVKMVLTGEGADELFAGYLYFMDSPDKHAVQGELKRIYSKLGQINLLRTDRMTMAHGLEARVPFLDVDFTRTAMSVDPELKLVHKEAVAANLPGREKTFLRRLFEEPNIDGHQIPHPVLWRAKAMQCEGVGEDWVSVLQHAVSSRVTDAEMDDAPRKFPLNTPVTKEEYYYRQLFESYFPGMQHVVKPWEGGCRAGGASWGSESYTREGLADVNLLAHGAQATHTH